MRRYIERKDEFDEDDELPSIKKKTGLRKLRQLIIVVMPVLMKAQVFKTLLLMSTFLSRLVKITHE